MAGDATAGPPLLESTLELLAATPATLRGLLGELPSSAVESRGAEGWSPKDVVAHLLDRHETGFAGRIRAMRDNDIPLLPNADEEVELERSGLRLRPLSELLDSFATQRADALAMVRALSPEQMQRAGRHSVAGMITIADIVHHHAYHDLLHVGQICGLLAAPVEARRGAMRMF